MNMLMSPPKEPPAKTNEMRPFSRMRSEFDRIFDRMMHEPWEISWMQRNGADWMPALEIVENERDVTIRADIPGVPAENVDVSISANILTISGQKDDKKEEVAGGCYMCERRFGSFRRAVELPQGLDPEKITAHQENGVLTIRIARLKGASPKRIAIQTGA